MFTLHICFIPLPRTQELHYLFVEPQIALGAVVHWLIFRISVIWLIKQYSTCLTKLARHAAGTFPFQKPVPVIIMNDVSSRNFFLSAIVRQHKRLEELKNLRRVLRLWISYAWLKNTFVRVSTIVNLNRFLNCVNGPQVTIISHRICIVGFWKEYLIRSVFIPSHWLLICLLFFILGAIFVPKNVIV